MPGSISSHSTDGGRGNPAASGWRTKSLADLGTANGLVRNRLVASNDPVERPARKRRVELTVRPQDVGSGGPDVKILEQ